MLVDFPSTARIKACAACHRGLPYSAPQAGVPVNLVGCGCGQRYFVGVDDLKIKGEYFDDFSPVQHLPHQNETELAKLIARIGDTCKTRKDDRRTHCRVRVALEIVAVPLDASFRPIGDAQHGATIDISVGGFAFVTTADPDPSFWLVDFGPTGNPGAQVVISVARRRSIDQGYWMVAGPLATRFDEPKRSESRIIHTRRRM